MTSLSDDLLMNLNRQALIPGPQETEKEFLSRAERCMQLSACLLKEGEPDFSFLKEPSEDKECLSEAFPITENLFDIAPTWLPVFFSNEQLAFWHGGSAWIFQTQDQPTAAFLQLRERFRFQKTLFKCYRRDELVAHELCHVGRMMFEEPCFEEILACRTSGSPLRRLLGPIVQSGVESFVFVFSLALTILMDSYFIFTGYHEAYILAALAKTIPLFLIFFAVLRLFRRHRTFNRCLLRLQKICGSEKVANAVIFRLTDKEIDSFSRSSEEEIRKYIAGEKELSLRWRLIHYAYMPGFFK